MSNAQDPIQTLLDAAAAIEQPKRFTFWSTQPVPTLNENITTNECIKTDREITENARTEPYPLPDGFKWDSLDLNNITDLCELYRLLRDNYIEDSNALFRFDYQLGFLKWSLQPPGWKREWHVGVRVVKSGRLVGFISAIPSTLRVYDKIIKLVEINYLCVHKKLRNKRVAPVLIREIARIVSLNGVFQAVYTAGIVIPKPISICRYWHRSLNPKKLIEVKFSHLDPNMTMQRTIKWYKLPEQPITKGFRRMEAKDMDKVQKLLDDYKKNFNLCPMYNKEDFHHWFTPQEGILECFVVEDENGNVTDMTSFYCLVASVMHHPVHKQLRAAFSYYNVSTKTPWVELINDAIISANNMKMDVFNALDIMENHTFLKPLRFRPGGGYLKYYLYNWRCPFVECKDVGLVLM